tara:strand:+ start:1964 stop:2176 length:213 start_codon:yes stop_codon:yes gene_type:complete
MAGLLTYSLALNPSRQLIFAFRHFENLNDISMLQLIGSGIIQRFGAYSCGNSSRILFFFKKALDSHFNSV